MRGSGAPYLLLIFFKKYIYIFLVSTVISTGRKNLQHMPLALLNRGRIYSTNNETESLF